ncbi:MAG TPA: glycosyltransferase family 4 protein [Usitatibacter sp.]|nr:glycosyltransferase family 4 protein [Usitatibacter sp.]
MRILHVTDKGASGGGVAIHVEQLCESLAHAGHEVRTLRLVADGREDGLAPERALERFPRSYGFVRGLQLRERLDTALRAHRPDVIHVHECFSTLSPVLLARMRRAAPVVGTLHDTRPFCYAMTRRFAPTGALCERRCGVGCFTSGCVRPRDAVDMARWARRCVVDAASLRQWRRLHRVIVPSVYLGELALRHGVPAARLRRVAHGPPVPEGTPERRDEPPLLAFVGSLLRYKGVHVMLEALERIRSRPWQAAFVGDGPERVAILEAIARAGLAARVRVVGHVADRRELDEILRRARLLELPSIVPESFAMAGLEALAAGTPVVTFGLGGIAEWLRPGVNGLLAADGDAKDLARHIERLLEDPQLAARLGACGRELVEHDFTPQRALEGVLAVYEEARKCS